MLATPEEWELESLIVDVALRVACYAVPTAIPDAELCLLHAYARRLAALRQAREAEPTEVDAPRKIRIINGEPVMVDTGTSIVTYAEHLERRAAALLQRAKASPSTASDDNEYVDPAQAVSWLLSTSNAQPANDDGKGRK